MASAGHQRYPSYGANLMIFRDKTRVPSAHLGDAERPEASYAGPPPVWYPLLPRSMTNASRSNPSEEI
jgi:hypothetical protein